MSKPRNIILIVADSLRYDAVFSGPSGLPYADATAIRFGAARSAGCWTLPATASMFTGLLPHEHGATAQTRGLREDVPTLAERLREAGYRTAQITANIATTDIFGLHRGFEQMRHVWTMVKPKHTLADQILVLAGKPRLRKKLFTKDFIMGRMASDLSMGRVWLQRTSTDVFNEARRVLSEHEARGEGSFLFLNLMETHFPYHVGPAFKLHSRWPWGKLRELHGLFHLANQTWLTTGRQPIRSDVLEVLRARQRRGWELLAPELDAFIEELHRDTGNLVVFCSDHGENFGEQGWVYHFSNVTDAGNRVPLYWLPHDGATARQEQTPVSARDLYPSLLHAAGLEGGEPILTQDPERSLPVLSSYWYNNQGRTLPQYRHNQLAFVHGDQRFRYRDGRWSVAPPATEGPEPEFQDLPAGVDPIEEAVSDAERRQALRGYLAGFQEFSRRISIV